MSRGWRNKRNKKSRRSKRMERMKNCGEKENDKNLEKWYSSKNEESPK